MTESLRALLAGAIDFAGMFPPAALSLEQALVKYRQHRSGPEAWIVGRFVCPGTQLDELASRFHPEPHSSVTTIIPDGKTAAALKGNLEGVSKLAMRFPDAGALDTLEFRWVPEPPQSGGSTTLSDFAIDAARTIVDCQIFPATMFFEPPLREAHITEQAWQQLMRDCVQKLAAYKGTTCAIHCPAGFKVRCGGAGRSAIPSSADIAPVICACRDARVFWKATAGLHHPFRHIEPELGVHVHGFINLLTAAVMADVHRLEPAQVQAILEDDDPWHFHFTNEALTWHDLSVTVPQIAGGRDRALRSFGSCSIDEPWQDLTVLGLI